MLIDSRKRQVLRAIVEDYVASAEPVGSRALARKHQLGVSSATIRNEMADLEAMGLLDKPHTSAGRVPSDRGYRLYVDSLMEPAQLDEARTAQVRSLFLSQVREIEYLINQTLHLLGASGDFMAIGMGPELGRATLVRVDALVAGPQRIVLVLVTDLYAQHRMLDVPDDMDPERLRDAVLVLSDRLRGLTVERITRDVIEMVARELRGRLKDEILDAIVTCLTPQEGERVRIAGTSNMLGQPEFRTSDRLTAMLRLIEREELLRDLLMQGPTTGVRVLIGEETQLETARDLSIVTLGVEREGEVVARFGLLGPKRMDYRHHVALAEQVWRALAEVLN